MQDNDGLFPSGADAVDSLTSAWTKAEDGEYAAQVGQLQPLTRVLKPYIKSRFIWKCPSDKGFDKDDISHEIISGRPTSFDAFGLSYYYRTELTLKRKNGLVSYEDYEPYLQHGPEDINVLADSDGSWHGERKQKSGRYNVLMADWHVESMRYDEYLSAWHLMLDAPSS